MELVMIFAIVMVLLLAVMLFLALGFYRGTFREYPPPLSDSNGQVYAPPPAIPPERPRDPNWRGV